MVQLLVGHKGTGKTKMMIDLANGSLDKVNGSVVFINKNPKLMHDINYRIRLISMEDFEGITNTDEYIGFIYGIISQDHDIEKIFIDSILKHADIGLENLGPFLDRLSKISEIYGPDFVVSLSADRSELGDVVERFPVLN